MSGVWPGLLVGVGGSAFWLLLSALSALAERSGPIRLRHFAREAGGRFFKLYESRRHFEAFRFLLSWSSKAALVAYFWLLVRLGPLPLALALTVLLAGAGELLNRLLVVRDPERSLERLTFAFRTAHFLTALLLPLFALFVPARPAPAREDRAEDEVTEEEIEAFLRVGTREGILEPGEEDMVRGIVDLGGTQVKSVMVPRTSMMVAPLDTSLEQLAQTFLDSNCSRLPLVADSIDEIVGVLHIRDLLGALRDPLRPLAVDLATPPLIVPESKRLGPLLREFQARKQEMAIVVDEYGGTSGLVTLEDLLEEIVGEIYSEHDEELPEPEALAEGRWRISGRAPVDDLGGVVGVDFSDAPYDTVGGLIFGVLGDLPKEGESVEVRGLKLTAEQVDDRRVGSVVVDLLDAELKESNV